MPSKVTLVFAATLALTTSSIVEAGRPRMHNPQRAERDVDFAIDADLDVDNYQKMRRDFSSSSPDDLKPAKSGDSGNVFDADTRQESPTAAVIVDQTVVVPSSLSPGYVRPESGTTGSAFPEVSTPEPTATSQNTAHISQQMASATTGRNILDPISSIIGDLLLPAPASANSTMVEPETSILLSSSPSTFEMSTRSSADVTSSSATASSPATVLSPFTVSLPAITFPLVTTLSPVTASSPIITSSSTTISSPSTVSLPAITLSLVTTLSPVTASPPATTSSPTTVSLPAITLSPVATLSPVTASLPSSPSSPATPDSLASAISVVPETSTEVTSRKTFESSARTTETPSGTGLIPILTSVVSSVLPVPTFESAVSVSSVVTKTSTDGTQITTSLTRIVPSAETAGLATPAFSSPTYTLSVPSLTPTYVPHGKTRTTTSGEATSLTPADSANDADTATATTITSTSSPLPASTETGVIGLSLSSNATRPATTFVESISNTVKSTATVTTRTETTLLTPTPISTQTSILDITTTVTGTSTSDWLPTTMTLDSASLSITVPTTTKTATTTSSLPANVPKVIVPFDDDRPAPKDSTLVQIGFKFPLNYDFVSSHSVAAAQIIHLLPKALVDAGNLDAEKVRIAKLVPFDTRNTAGYITTLAKLYYPHDLVDNLKASIWAPNSKLYNNPSKLVNNLTALIDPTINIIGNNDGEGAKTSGSSSNNNDAFGPGSDQSSQSSKQRATTAGIVVGAVGIGAVYGAAIFIVARRYKRKRQNHRLSLSSVDRSDAIQYADKSSPAFSDGALLRPKRGMYGGRSQNSLRSTLSANISAPVATENSLGWN